MYPQNASAQGRLFITPLSCVEFGVWENNTCTLNKDIDVPITIQRAGSTLDGNGYTLRVDAVPNGAIEVLSEGVTIKNLYIESDDEYGIYLNDQSNGTTIKQVVVRARSGGVAIKEADNVILENVYVRSNNQNEIVIGITIQAAQNTTIKRLRIANAQTGVNAFASNQLTINDSLFSSSAVGLIINVSNDVTLSNTTIRGSIDAAIRFEQVSNTLIAGNLIDLTNTNGAGFDLRIAGQPQDFLVRDNQIIGGRAGIDGRFNFGGPGGPIQQVFLNNIRNIFADAWSQVVPTVLAQSLSSITFWNNDFVANSVAHTIPIDASGLIALSQLGTGNYWSSYDEPAEGCADTDTNDICDDEFQSESAEGESYLSDEFPRTAAIATVDIKQQPSCELEAPAEVALNQPFELEYTTSDATSGLVLDVGLATDDAGSFAVTPTELGQQIYTMVVWGSGAPGECEVTVEVAETVAPAGASSVLFLPGIQASRLYKDGLLGTEDQLWTPTNTYSQDVRQLEMTTGGVSVNKIYTKDVLDSALGVGSVYEGMLNHLDALVSDSTISSYRAFAYDWRFAPDSIVQTGTAYQQGVLDLIKVVEVLSQEAGNNKVTIIGHSNGGLLAKALVAELEKRGEADVVDQMIFIGTPHIGTPKAIATILHGYDQAKDFMGIPVIQSEVAREVINNMPGAYGLLPTPAYFSAVSEPIVTIDNATATEALFAAYGSTISNYQEFTTFLSGQDNLNRSLNQSTSIPATINTALYQKALQEHIDLLDAWQAPDSIKVTQIVGVGLPTVDRLLYREIEQEKCISAGPAGVVCGINKLLKPFAQLSHDGDETVVSVSAGAYAGASDVQFIELIKASNQSEFDIRHYNLTEADEVQQLVTNILIGTTSAYSYITSNKPQISAEYDIEAIDSPVLISATDVNGNTTGLTIENNELVMKSEIPGSQYFELGETKYLVLPSDVERTTTLVGTGRGGYTLTLATLNQADEQEIHSMLQNASVTPSMVATYQKTSEGYSDIETDLDGDGAIDLITTVTGESVELPSETTFADLRRAIESLSIPNAKQRILTKFVDRAEYYAIKSEQNSQYERIAKIYYRIISRIIKWFERGGVISKEERNEIQEIISELKKNVWEK